MAKPRPDMALFIDFENISAQGGFDAGELVSQLEPRGRLIVKRAYADWHQFAHFKARLLEASVHLVECPTYHQRKRNSTDIRLSIDAIQMAMTHPAIETFVIVSGDSDFIPLIERLREMGRAVIVVAAAAVASHLLRRFCDELIIFPEDEIEAEWEGVSPDDDVFDALIQALMRLSADKPAPHRSSEIKNMMLQLDAGFDERKRGYRKFKDYLMAARASGLIQVQGMRYGNALVSLDPRQTLQRHVVQPAASPTERLHSALKERDVLFLGAQLQERVLRVFFERLQERGWPQDGPSLFDTILREDLHDVADDLPPNALQRVMRLLVQADCVGWNIDEDRKTRMALRHGVDTFEVLRQAHDRLLLNLATGAGVTFEDALWEHLLHGDPVQRAALALQQDEEPTLDPVAEHEFVDDADAQRSPEPDTAQAEALPEVARSATGEDAEPWLA